MKTQNLYRTLVVGSGALLVGCAASKSVEKSAEPTQNEAVSASEQGGNAAKTTEAAPPTEINPTRPDGNHFRRRITGAMSAREMAAPCYAQTQRSGE